MGAKKETLVEVANSNGRVVLRPRGRLDEERASHVEQLLLQLQETSSDCKVTIDLGEVRRAEYFGIAILARIIRALRHRFAELSLAGMGATTEGLFRRFGVVNAPRIS